jgi:hypothetical protein
MMARFRIALAMLCAWVALIGAAVLLWRGPGGLGALLWFVFVSGAGVLILPASIQYGPDDGARSPGEGNK